MAEYKINNIKKKIVFYLIGTAVISVIWGLFSFGGIESERHCMNGAVASPELPEVFKILMDGIFSLQGTRYGSCIPNYWELYRSLFTDMLIMLALLWVQGVIIFVVLQGMLYALFKAKQGHEKWQRYLADKEKEDDFF